MEGEAARAALQEKYPQWQVWRNGTVVYARWLNSSPSICLSGSSYAALEARIPLAVEAWQRTHSYRATLKAAGQEET